MFGPLSLDLYLPALPQLADDLGTSASAAQLSITACLVGLALGQLVAGPLSDRLGRRRPLMVGLLAYLLASVACALAPSVMVLVVLRLIQGLGGAAGIVISRAIARDLYSGRQLMIFFSRLLLIAGLAPVIAPILGGQLSRIMSWRGIFGVLAVFGAVLLLAGWFGLRETLPPERRIVGGFRRTLHGYNTLVHDRFFVGCALSSGLAGASMFAYIAGSTFVLQRIYGMSPQGFSLVFGCISLGLVAAAQGGARLALLWPLTRVLALGLTIDNRSDDSNHIGRSVQWRPEPGRGDRRSARHRDGIGLHCWPARAGRIPVHLVIPANAVGYLLGIAVLVVASQLGRQLGYVVSHLSEINLATVIMSAGMLVVLFVGGRLLPRLPWTLIAMLLAAGIAAFGHLERYGIELVGPIPAGWPKLSSPPGTKVPMINDQ
jgi:Bcr/CflA subfamily drug resistance transporter